MTIELEHGMTLTTDEAVALLNEGIARATLSPACIDLWLRRGGNIAIYVAGPHRGTFRYEEWTHA